MPLQLRNASMVELLTPDFYRRDVWHIWTPVITQGAVVTWTDNYNPSFNRFCVLGDIVFLSFNVKCTSAGTAGNAIQISGYPSYIQPMGLGGSPGCGGIGNFIFWRGAGGNPRYHFGCYFELATYIVLNGYNTTANVGIDPAITLANNDYLKFFITYQRST